jgi:hypothetical protein
MVLLVLDHCFGSTDMEWLTVRRFFRIADNLGWLVVHHPVNVVVSALALSGLRVDKVLKLNVRSLMDSVAKLSLMSGADRSIWLFRFFRVGTNTPIPITPGKQLQILVARAR